MTIKNIPHYFQYQKGVIKLFIFSCLVITISFLLSISSHRDSIESRLVPALFKPEQIGYSRVASKPSFESIKAQYFPIEFTTSLPPHTKTVRVELILSCEPSCQQVWLVVENNQLQENILVDHQGIRQLPYFFVSNGFYQFYQRQLSFANLDEYLDAGLPGNLFTEKAMADNFFKLGKQTSLLEENLDLSEADYVLTTYQFPKHHGEWYFARDIDVSDYDLSQKISFTLNHKEIDTTTNPRLYLFPPVITYR